MRRIKTAIIGCGKVGETHAKAYKDLEETELVASFSRTKSKAEYFSKTFSIKSYTDIEEMFSENKIDAVSICTPHPSHLQMIEIAAKHGAHILTEKPLASTLSDCDNAISICQKCKVKLSVVSQRRFYPPILRMKDAINDGKLETAIIGTVSVMGWRSKEYYEMDKWRGTWDLEGGGVMVNQAIHQLDLLQWFLGDIDSLFGYWDNFNHPTIEVDDTAIAVLRFKSGAMGQFLVSNCQKPGLYGKIHVHGSNGASVGAQTEGGSPFIAGITTKVDPPINDIWTIPGEEHLLSKYQEEDRNFAATHDTMVYYHKLQIKDFIQSILNGSEPSVTGNDGRKAVEIFTAVYRSQRDNRQIKFPLEAEISQNDFDGRLNRKLFSQK